MIYLKKINCIWLLKFLEKLSGQLNAENVDYKGTKEFTPYMVKETFTDKTLNIVNDGSSDKELGVAQSETTNQALNMGLSGIMTGLYLTKTTVLQKRNTSSNS